MDTYAVGQRWASQMEPELGIGIIEAVEGRQVRLKFPDSNMVRLYAAQSAPLRRVVFHPGDRVTDDTGVALTISAVEVEDDLLMYCGDGKCLREDRLAGFLALDTPKERMMVGQRDTSRVFDLRHRILEYRCRMVGSPVEGFVGGRVDLIPHQFAIAAEVSDRMRPRVLLADETGLGKTIEAGLIMHRLVTTGRISRILTVVPDALVVQWYVELARRFNLRFRIFDEEWRAACATTDGGNPFDVEPLGLCGTSFLTMAAPALKKQLIDGHYELLVVDEAHHMHPDGPLFDLVEQLSQTIPQVVLITATPGHLSSRGHFARLRLLDPERYPSYERFKAENQSFEQIARLVKALANGDPIDDAVISQLTGSLGIPAQAIDDIPSSSTGRQQLMKRIIDRYGTGRVMFRTTRRMVTGFPGRNVLMLPLDAKEPGDAVRHRIDREILQDCGLQPQDPDVRFVDDPRVAWIEGYLRAYWDQKTLLICRSVRKVEALHKELRKRINAKIGRYHDEMTLVQRDRNAAWFADPDGAVLLLCSEIGSEGRNFQFARHLILFDLPADPELLEQRIGRLDRIGQTGEVQVMVPFVRGTGGEILARWYHDALGAMERSVPAAGWVTRRCFGPLTALIRDAGGETVDIRLERLIRCGRLAVNRQQRRIESGRDRLLELGALSAPVVDQLIADIRAIDADSAFTELAEQLLDAWGIVMDPIASGVYRLVPDQRYADPLPGFRPSGLTVTTDRALALTHEEIDFLTADHPLVTGAIEHHLGTGKGSAAFACWPSKGDQQVFLEMLFVVEAVALINPALRPFLPPTPLRVVVDLQLNDGQPGLPTHALHHLTDGSASLWSMILPVVSRLIPQMVEAGRTMAQNKAKPIIDAAQREARQTMGETVTRLEVLQRVNPAIRQRDIDAAQKKQDVVLAAIATARVRLDALRLVVKGKTG